MKVKHNNNHLIFPDLPDTAGCHLTAKAFFTGENFNQQSRQLGQFVTGLIEGQSDPLPLGQLLGKDLPVEDAQSRVEIICQHPTTKDVFFPGGELPTVYTDVPRAYADAAFGWLSQRLASESFLFFAVPAKFWQWDDTLQSLIRNFVVYTELEANLDAALNQPGWISLEDWQQQKPQLGGWLQQILAKL